MILYKKTIFTTVFIIILNVFLTNAVDLPYKFGETHSGLDVVKDKNYRIYNLKLELSIENLPLNSELSIPVAGSTDFNEITLTGVKHFTIENINYDALGNPVIIGIPSKENPVFSFEIKSFSGTSTLSTIYDYKLDISQSWHDRHKAFYKKQFNYKEVSYNNDEVYKMLKKLIDDYKTSYNSSSYAHRRLYEKKAMQLYPFTRAMYYAAAKQFIEFAAEHGFTTRVVHGWRFPEGIDNYYRDFLVEIMTNDGKTFTFDYKLDDYKMKSNFVRWINDAYENELFSSFQVVYSVGGVNGFVTIVPQSENNGHIFEVLSDSGRAYIPEKESFSTIEYIVETPLFDENNEPFSVKKRLEKQMRETDAQPDHIKEAVLCVNVINGKPVTVKERFSNMTKFHAFIRFNSAPASRTLKYEWIKPSGEVFHSKPVSIAGNWSYYYISFNSGNYAMEKGTWLLKLSVNSKVEFYIPFVLE